MNILKVVGFGATNGYFIWNVNNISKKLLKNQGDVKLLPSG